jgi:hypothetical protein
MNSPKNFLATVMMFGILVLIVVYLGYVLINDRSFQNSLKNLNEEVKMSKNLQNGG